ncbi:hypothetical protein [Pseudoalteromonas prydzensis]|uniref:hypothetical protein n=1 Tax=Pseudoalteromonas prydzensis TaxID=182141 RepID=UPI003FD045A2
MRKLSRKRLIKLIPAMGTDCNAIKVELVYLAGGLDFFTYKNVERGYYLSVSAVKIYDDNGRQSQASVAGARKRTLITTASRYSKRTLDKTSVTEGSYMGLVKGLAGQLNLTINTPAAA